MGFEPTAPEQSCRHERRRHLIRDVRPSLNGIDYVEVGDDGRTLHVYFLNKLSTPSEGGAAVAIERQNVRIDGGARVRGIQVLEVEPCRIDDPERDDCLKVVVDRPGDFSTYTLRLVDVDEHGRPSGPLGGFDPRYASIAFSFSVTCDSDLDCRQADVCPAPADAPIEISYLAKDYASFRQLALDRLALLMPEWRERHVPDIGIAIVEVLAYAGDYLSYYQDAVATEAYLDTARRRVSVRRHARLVDYHAHEGCNARVWVSIETTADLPPPAGEPLGPKDLCFVAGLRGRARPAGLLTSTELARFEPDQYEVFEPVVVPGSDGPIRLYKDHNVLSFYTWGDHECCLPRGATRATVKDPWPPDPLPDPDYEQMRKTARTPKYETPPAPAPPAGRERLRKGDVLLFVEIRGPRTGNEADADPLHRHAVRLTEVRYGEDRAVQDPTISGRFQRVIDIAWGPDDALPFPLCLSTVAGPQCEPIDVSVAWGNVVLADHGRTIEDEDLGAVPGSTQGLPCTCPGTPGDIVFEDGRFNPTLGASPLTFTVPLPVHEPERLASAAALVPGVAEPRGATPSVRAWSIPPKPWEVAPLFAVDAVRTRERFLEFVEWLRTSEDPGAGYLRSLLQPDTLDRLSRLPGDLSTLGEDMQAVRRELLQPWTPRNDLLESDTTDAHFVVEIDDEARARLRFGDGELGRRPRAGTGFLATYRVGSGTAGNVGANAIAHIVLPRTTLSGIELIPRNPLPAVGGTAPEPTADVRLLAPHAFRSQLERGITADDYAQLAARHPDVQRAAAEVRWTGSRQLVVVGVDQRGRAEASEAVLAEVRRRLARYRRIGHDLVVTRARYVPLDLAMTVEVRAEFIAGHVKAALLDRLSSRTLADGRRGFFHPDELSFGDGVHLSRLVAAALEIPGVQHVCVTRLQRLFESPRGELEAGELPIAPLEIARLDSDRNFPEHGQLVLTMRGGR
jgi:hypothetical protein